MWSTLLFALMIVGISLALLVHQQRDWERTARSISGDALPQGFVLQRHRRRMTVAIVMAVLGIAMMPSILVRDATQLVFWWYWVGLLMGGLLLIGFAVADFVGSHRYLREQRQLLRAERQAWLNEVAARRAVAPDRRDAAH